DVAAEAAALVVQGRDDHVGPEARAVLAQAPAFILDAALGLGHLQQALRLARGEILRREEAREVLPDDLLGPVALDALGAAVPAHHAALLVEHEDRVVLHRLDQQPELFLAAAPRLWGMRIAHRPALQEIVCPWSRA